MADKKINNKFFMYKGFPLVRCGNIMYYGNMSDKYIIMLQILENKTVKDLSVASKVSVQLQYTDADLNAKARVIKSLEKSGLYAAMDVATIWLERALDGKI